MSFDESRLREALGDIERPILFEHSVKAIPDGLIKGRYLVSFPRAALGPGPSRKLREMLDALDAPLDGVAQLDEVQSSSQSVHFGFEPDPQGTLMKCYLEFSESMRAQPDLTFMAMKWDANGKFAITFYHDRDALSREIQNQLVKQILPNGAVRDAFLSLMTSSSTHKALRFLEVTEPGNPRRSFDLNLSEQSLKLSDHHELLLTLLGGGQEADAYLKQHRDDSLGHIAAGTARNGLAFGTLYHGAHRVWGPL